MEHREMVNTSTIDEESQVESSHWSVLLPRLLEGKVVLFLGAGINVFVRPSGKPWSVGDYLPTGAELARHLADLVSYTGTDREDLLRVSQYMTLYQGSASLYDELRQLLNADYPTTPLHEFIATLPARMREAGTPRRYPLIVTTNYDDVLEKRLTAHDEPFDLVWYVADGQQRGKFWHRTPDGQIVLIEKPNEYLAVNPEQRVVILKIHGNMDRVDPERDSYVITEDHYIEYLTRTEIGNLLPIKLAQTLKKSHFLFLGYGLRDWNLRVILHRIWDQQKLTYRSWAIQRDPSELDRRFWAQRSVDVMESELGEYIAELAARTLARISAIERKASGT
jgi:hypothetical protein